MEKSARSILSALISSEMRSRYHLLSILCLVLALTLFEGCNLPEEVKEASRIMSAVEEEFELDNGGTSLHWGDEDYIIFYFTEFDLNRYSSQELEGLAQDIYDFILEESPRMERQDFLEIKFTEGEALGESERNIASFRFE